MALITRNPTSNTTPDPGQGGNAVTGNINTGHSDTTSSVSGSSSNSQNKTCIWQSFLGIVAVGQIKSIDLKFDWVVVTGSTSANTTDPGETAEAATVFTVETSINGGGAWTTRVSETVSSFAQDGGSDSDGNTPSGSVTVSLSIIQDLTQVRVRDSLGASINVNGAGASASATLTANISNIRIEAVIADPPLIVMM